MCGLYGWIRAADAPAPVCEAMALLSRMLCAVNQMRGEDSTGWAWGGAGQEPQLLRAPLPANKFLREQATAYAPAFAPATQWLIGHTRAATIGAIDLANTHPFQFKGLIGAHNGSITNHLSFNADKLEGLSVPDCDSAHLLAHAATVGMKAALADARGSIALSVTNAPYDAVTLYQDAADRLAVAYVKAWRAAVWSSDSEHLIAGLATLGIVLNGNASGKAGYLLALPVEELTTIASDAITARRIRWRTVDAPSGGFGRIATTYDSAVYPTGYVDDTLAHSTHGYGRAYGDTLPTTIITNDANAAVPKGFHKGAEDKYTLHEGKRKRCVLCMAQRRTAQRVDAWRKHTLRSHSQPASTGRIDAVKLATAGAVVYTYNGNDDAPSWRFKQTIIPVPVGLTVCPDCRYTEQMVWHPLATAWSCRRCRAWIEVSPVPHTPTAYLPSTYGGD